MARIRKKSSSLFIKIVLMLVIVYLLYIFIDIQIKINNKKAQINGTDLQISSAKIENDRLSGIYNAETDSEYYEKLAREKGFISQGEKVYQAITE